MPTEFGYIAKAYIAQDLNLNPDTDKANTTSNNPLALSVYILTNNNESKLVNANSAVKQNLKTYLSQYKILTDAVNIKDAYYVNIGINFEIQVLQGFNAQQVLVGCINKLKEFFNTTKWSINQPIILSQVENAISSAGVNGVAAVKKIEFVNKAGGNYSPYSYDLTGATLNGVIYPSLDPSIFEIRYPDQDIYGRVVGM
jgi:phage-related baseplate assembly protein